MAVTRVFEGFSVSHAGILDSTTGNTHAGWGDIYGVRGGSVQVAADSYDNTGDQAVLSTWFWFNYADVAISSGYVPYDTIAQITGATMTSSGAADANQVFSVPLWTEDSLNQATVSMIVRVPSKSSDGTVRTLDFILYKVQLQPISFDGPVYKDGLVLNYNGRALISSTDEKGNALSVRAIGRLVSSGASPATS
jgi:hypothetical protein